ncbi:hypothetical protein PBOR_21865 [Paenibacillus borealis]|uniref:Uncharacterized protein n=2 Tax=Paenibacillus borealis TaxID=160799 RepID=A0A089LGR9_PAEBO|nr:hypothetical protein PBOR_21865 [Paenibacillus borealis]
MYGGYNESNPLIFGSKAFFEINENLDKFVASVTIEESDTGKDVLKNLQEIKGTAPSGYTYVQIFSQRIRRKSLQRLGWILNS